MRPSRMALPLLGLAAFLAACGVRGGLALAFRPRPLGRRRGSDVAANVASTSLGDVLVDGKGMNALRVHRGNADGKSACAAGRLDNWPALVGGGAAPGTGRRLELRHDHP